MKYSRYLLLCGALAAVATGCDRDPKFKVAGDVDGAGGMTLFLEKSDFHGNWIAVDSTKVSGSGSFSIKADAPASPEIYRISLGDRFVYFPVDSTETITLTSSEKKFGTDFSLSGSTGAENLAAFEKELMELANPDSTALAHFKRNAYTKYIKDSKGSIVSYYVLTKFYDGKPLYDPADHTDTKYYAAVATQFDQYRPDDPHGRMVKSVSLQAMRERNSAKGKKTVVRAQEVRVLDIDLPDETGKNVKLSQIVGKGKPVAVIFSMMNEAESPAFNRQLARIYNSRGGNVQFYHVSFDRGQYEWREAARNLPWITVIDPGGMASDVMRDYNIGSLPAVFLYDAGGDLVDRPASLDDLEKKL